MLLLGGCFIGGSADRSSGLLERIEVAPVIDNQKQDSERHPARVCLVIDTFRAGSGCSGS
jgi:hypothetical protein